MQLDEANGTAVKDVFTLPQVDGLLVTTLSRVPLGTGPNRGQNPQSAAAAAKPKAPAKRQPRRAAAATTAAQAKKEDESKVRPDELAKAEIKHSALKTYILVLVQPLYRASSPDAWKAALSSGRVRKALESSGAAVEEVLKGVAGAAAGEEAMEVDGEGEEGGMRASDGVAKALKASRARAERFLQRLD